MLALLCAGGCATAGRVEVGSTPAGARILIDGVDSGQQTPSSVVLSTSQKRYTLTIEKPGFNPASREVVFTKQVDVIDADEAVASILCAPCCCFLPLFNLLDPVDVETRFVPSHIHAMLEVAGQGARLEVTPAEFETYLDGRLVTLLEGNYLVTTPGLHELEIRAAGRRPYARSIQVDERVYQPMKVELPIEGQGLLLTGSPDGAKVYVDDQYQGALGDGARRVRAEPGPHLLRIEAEGYRPWQDVVQLTADRFDELRIELALEGQGILVRKPEGLPSKTPDIQVIVDGKVHASAFDQPIRLEPGEHEIEIRVHGREPRRVRVQIEANAWLDLEPGARGDPRGPKSQAVLDVQGVRIVEPEGLPPGLGPEDVQILVDGALAAEALGRLIPIASEGDHDVVVQVRGFRPWSQRVRVTSRQVLDVWPRLERE
jgi:hypothetical protein